MTDTFKISSTSKIGVIGLGNMGWHMASRLKAVGAQVFIHTRTREKAADLEELGLLYCDSPLDLAEKVGSGIVIICVTNTPAVEAVIKDKKGLLAGLEAGALVIDMGTTQVMSTRIFADLVCGKGADYLDAPVSGGAIGAEKGTLSIMVGGTEAVFQRARPVFEALGKNINLIGIIGAGQIAKSANQMIVAMTIDAVAEALVLSAAAGADPSKVRQALMGGFADSRILDLHGQRMIERAFDPGARATVQLKDVNQAMELAEYYGAYLPGLEKNQELWQNMVDADMGDLDQAGFICSIESLSNVKKENK
ncbi:NAD(P)-dependent oxidoreductase [Kiloniella antarctica]|uniref:NAD(P)-dependent oxidoreductase n=1 Tax=Kiloniella antarctica TaxID=1550907 RepID=A0ABW5BKB3_9PROT